MLGDLPRTPLDNAVELIQAEAAALNESNVCNPHTEPFYRENRRERRGDLLSSVGISSIRRAAQESACDRGGIPGICLGHRRDVLSLSCLCQRRRLTHCPTLPGPTVFVRSCPISCSANSEGKPK
jgi:hypothetical protein